ncbi:hypothetical protein AJ80_00045 [Polytolypa hystricis UAMH7299]|uniref:G-patch domain-containing protein n=1 Tax=Polytolypa hystricis (strain UAMH7299) TaxID=1447883 RepID=A0A2B7Z3H7_POLH7|nr:hypothetical protein AJ80_00045 [Polytolypa hystricis UAMH7299]
MDAQAYLIRQGWSGPGNPLNPTRRPGPHGGLGLTKPILVARKKNNHGIGKKTTHDHANQWWLRGFEDALKGVGEDGTATPTSQEEDDNGSARFRTGLSCELYKFFVRGEVLEGTLEVRRTVEVVGVKEEKKKKMKEEGKSGKRKRGDEERESKEERALRKEERRKKRKLREERDAAAGLDDKAVTKEERRRRKKEKKDKKDAGATSEELSDTPDVNGSADNDEGEGKRKKRQKEDVAETDVALVDEPGPSNDEAGEGSSADAKNRKEKKREKSEKKADKERRELKRKTKESKGPKEGKAGKGEIRREINTSVFFF